MKTFNEFCEALRHAQDRDKYHELQSQLDRAISRAVYDSWMRLSNKDKMDYWRDYFSTRGGEHQMRDLEDPLNDYAPTFKDEQYRLLVRKDPIIRRLLRQLQDISDE